MRVTEKNSTDSAMGRRPVWVTRRTNSVGRMVKMLENARFDWPKNSNMVFLIGSTVGTMVLTFLKKMRVSVLWYRYLGTVILSKCNEISNFYQSKHAISNFTTKCPFVVVLRATETGRRPIAESVEFFSVARMGV